MGAKPFVLRLRNAIGEAMNHLSDSSLQYLADINRDNPRVDPQTLVYSIRNAYGNPARMGSNKTVQSVFGMLPYANVAAQELASMGSAFAARPFGTGLRVATGLSTLALASILTHMRSAQHLDFLQNQLSLQQREANVTLALNDDPTKATIIPLPPSLHTAYALALDIWSKAVNTIGARHDPAAFNGAWDSLKSFFDGHITTSNATAMRRGVVDALDFLNLPPFVGHIDYNKLAANGWRSFPDAASSPFEAPPPKPALPGQGADAPLDSRMGEAVHSYMHTRS